jgi:conjugative relaxase-like TrwC/TraI family protein
LKNSFVPQGRDKKIFASPHGGQDLRRLHAHDTSRALDPHLHTHCIVFNATFDPVENRWKTLQNYELLRARKFAENAYYHELARELRTFGYQIRNRARGDFQVEGVSEELC